MSESHKRMPFKERLVALAALLKSIFAKETIFEDISIHGESGYSAQIIGALNLLKDRSHDAYLVVTSNVDVIYQGKKDDIATFGKGPGSLVIDATDQSTEWIAGKIYYESKRLSLIHKIRKGGRKFMSPQEYSYKRVADEHYQILKDIGADYEELKHLADWIEEELNKTEFA